VELADVFTRHSLLTTFHLRPPTCQAGPRKETCYERTSRIAGDQKTVPGKGLRHRRGRGAHWRAGHGLSRTGPGRDEIPPLRAHRPDDLGDRAGLRQRAEVADVRAGAVQQVPRGHPGDRPQAVGPGRELRGHLVRLPRHGGAAGKCAQRPPRRRDHLHLARPAPQHARGRHRSVRREPQAISDRPHRLLLLAPASSG